MRHVCGTPAILSLANKLELLLATGTFSRLARKTLDASHGDDAMDKCRFGNNWAGIFSKFGLPVYSSYTVGVRVLRAGSLRAADLSGSMRESCGMHGRFTCRQKRACAGPYAFPDPPRKHSMMSAQATLGMMMAFG